MSSCPSRHGGRALLDQLLIATLHRALALAERKHMALLIGHNLYLNVMRRRDELLHVALAVAKNGLALGACFNKMAFAASSTRSTLRMPRPPPPARALMSTGQPMRSASAVASSGLLSKSQPGTMGTPPRQPFDARRPYRPCCRSPRPKDRPNARPYLSQSRTKLAFSEKKP